jgi:hypothetical protein
MRVWAFNGVSLADVAGPVSRSIRTDVSCGQKAGEYFPFGFGPGELPDDQSADDAKSMCFDGQVLIEDLEIVGAARVVLSLASDQSRAQVALRLCDLRPDETSALIAHGFLNLRHRGGHDRVVDMPLGEIVEVEIVLDQVAYRIPKGHRLRVAISPSYFPFVWPDDQAVSLRLEAGSLHLPVLDGEDVAVAFDPAKGAEGIEFKRYSGRVESKKLLRNGDVWRQEIVGDDGLIENPLTGLKTAQKVYEVFEITEGDPSSARAKFSWKRSYGRGDWMVHTKSHVAVSSNNGQFLVEAALDAFEGELVIFSKKWSQRIDKI